MSQEIFILEACKKMSAQAEADESYTLRCLAGEKVFYAEHTHGLIPGHIYSELGRYEFKISQSCEYHFDMWTAEPDEGE